VNGGEFVTFYPKPESKFYLFNTSLDIQAPQGHVIATHPHPRFFTDQTGTVPLSLSGHVQTEWWPKKFFVVFKIPSPGQRHIFRKGEPYTELRVVPQRSRYQLQRMDGMQELQRRELERDILVAAPEIASNVWQNPSGYAFNNHYKILASTFARDGIEGVKQAVALAIKEQRGGLSDDAPIPDLTALGLKRFGEKRYNEAKQIFVNVLRRESTNAFAVNRLGVIAAVQGMPLLALKLMRQAVTLHADCPAYLDDLGELCRRLERFDEAESVLRASIAIDPSNAQAWSTLGLTLAYNGRIVDGIAACEKALLVGPDLPGPYYRLGLIFTLQKRFEEAKQHFDAALMRDPEYDEARRSRDELP
jgi:tetratricopeptide (TPR) repeat protein